MKIFESLDDLHETPDFCPLHGPVASCSFEADDDLELDNYGQIVVYTGLFLHRDGTVHSEQEGAE